jgi:hypothetical protein
MDLDVGDEQDADVETRISHRPYYGYGDVPKIRLGHAFGRLAGYRIPGG